MNANEAYAKNQITSRLLKPNRPVGITGYGAYVPRYRLPAVEVARVWAGGKAGGLPVKEKAVAGLDEDVITMSIEAARNALARAQIDPASCCARCGSARNRTPTRSNPARRWWPKPSAPHRTSRPATGNSPARPAPKRMVAAMGLVGSGMADYALAIGMDTAQGQPGDALEYTAASGGAAYIIGPAENALAVIEASYSYVTDTPDFWRRAEQKYPEHGQRFTGEPAYFKHITEAGSTLMEEMGTNAAGLHLRHLPPAQHQVPAAGGQPAGLHR